MNSDNKLKEIDIKSHACYDFDVIKNIIGLDLDNILVDEKSYGKFLVYVVQSICVLFLIK